MKIAIGTNDQQNINPHHFGESRYFFVVEISDNTRVSAYRENPWWNLEVSQRAPRIAALLGDCDAIVIRGIAKQGLDILSQTFRSIFLTRLTDLNEIAARLARGEMADFQAYNPATQKFER